MRYFLQLSYCGAPFHGWQIQPNAISVQETIENGLSTLLRKKTSLTGAGRTDSGVNARMMFAHFDCEKPIVDTTKFLLSINRIIGKDITIEHLIPVVSDAHARFDATSRTYKYFIGFKKNPFLKNLFWLAPNSLDCDSMNIAAQMLIQTTDFTSFAKLHSDVKTNICNVREAVWRKIKDDKAASDFIGLLDDGIVFTITADRFLRNMVRAVVGTMIEVGRKKISIDDFQKIINAKDRCEAGTSMPPEALYLWEVEYPSSIFQ